MLKLRKILVPVDLSSRSGPAVKHGVNIAKHFNADLIVLHAIPSLPYDAALAGGYPGGLAWSPSPNSAQRLDEILADFLEKTVPGHSVERIVARAEPAELIARIVAERGIDLIVMPTSGRGAFRRFILGSVTTKVLNDVDCPVLTGAHVDGISAFALKPYKKVGCAVDLGEHSAHVLDTGKDFAAAYRAGITAIHAISALSESPVFSAKGSDPPVTSLKERAESETERLLEEANVSAESVVEYGSPEEIIPKIVESADVDLLVVGRHGSEGNLNGLLTHAYGLIRKSPCPVLSV